MQSSKIRYNEKGLIDGEHRTYFDDGSIQQIYNFKDEIPHGVHTEFYQNGNKLGECTYVDGKRHGQYTEWSENGCILYHVQYENDDEIGIGTMYNPDGTVKYTIDFDHQLFITTDETGNTTNRKYFHTHWRKRNDFTPKRRSDIKNIAF